MTKTEPMETTFDVRFYETDGLGHVGNTVHVGWLEAARDPLFRLFVPDLDLTAWPLILASYKVDFLKQIYYGKSVTVKTWVGRLGSSSFDVYQEIWQEGEHCATGTTTMVHFNYNTQKAEPVPDAVREKMQNWLKDQSMYGKDTDFITVTDNVLSPELCKDIIAAFDGSANLAPGKTGGGIDTDKKRSTDVSFTQDPVFQPFHKEVMTKTGNELLKYIDEYFFALVGPIGLTVRHPQTGQPVKLTGDNYAEVGRPNLANMVNYLFRIGDINTQRYKAAEGGYPYWHSEVYPQLQHNDALHRVMLFMFYLNDVEEGGETDFYYQGKSIKPKAGRMVIAPAHFTHTHRGNIPVSNDKYILTSWMLFNRAEQIYTQ